MVARVNMVSPVFAGRSRRADSGERRILADSTWLTARIVRQVSCGEQPAGSVRQRTSTDALQSFVGSISLPESGRRCLSFGRWVPACPTATP
jgi:hypothetical protein